ncbi:MAG: hypothetical protein AAF368_19615, partial [Planctomycetota bacterium]
LRPLFSPPRKPLGPPALPSAMKIKTRNSKSKKRKLTGYRTRQQTKGGRKVNKRQRARHGSF